MDRPAQSLFLFMDVPDVTVPMDPMIISVAKRDMKDILAGSAMSLGDSVFKFPMSAHDERECLTPQQINPDAIAYIKSSINPDFNPQKPSGNAPPPPPPPPVAAADKFCKRVVERTATLAHLLGFQVQVQAFLHHAFLEQEELHHALQDDP